MSAARASLALASFSVAAAMVVACEATPDLEFDGGGALAGDATLPVDSGGDRDASLERDAATDHDAGSDADADASDAGAVVDANTCGLAADAPTGAGCCGLVRCIGPACNHCPRCENLACSGATGWCCGKENDAGKFQVDQCAADPADPATCPLK